jgi:hypothetical protein
MSEFFRPHGEFRSHLDGRLVVTEVTGPWNKELVEAWARHIYPYVKQLSADGPHVGLGIIRGSMLCPPDAMEELARVIRHGVTKLHSIGEFIVVDRTVEGRGLVEPAYERIYEGLVPFQFYDTVEEARARADEVLRAYYAAEAAKEIVNAGISGSAPETRDKRNIFRPHGWYGNSRIEGRSIITEFNGPWNKELIGNWSRDITPMAKEIGKQGPYAGIAVIRKSMLCPPDALELLELAVKYSAEKLNCIAHIIVADKNVEGRNLVEQTYARIYAPHVAYNFFDTLEEARSWADALVASREREAAGKSKKK